VNESRSSSCSRSGNAANEHNLLGDLLDELDAEFGPVSPELLEWAKRQWPDEGEEGEE
jgi:hypothetical protein